MDPFPGSPMLVDTDEYDNVDERSDTAIINPQQLDEDVDELEQEPLASDFEAMKARVLKEIPDLETEAEAVSTWHIEGWRHLAKRLHGPLFHCGGHPWRILFFPYGNKVEHASFYLEQGYDPAPPEDWYACVQFALVMWNPQDPSIYHTHTATHRFNADEGDWGFTRFAELRKLFGRRWEDRDRPMVEKDAVNITAYVRILKDPTGVLWHNFINYDSKKETGYVGLRNQGATCYLNSLLQSLYFTNAFRKAVYQIPTENEKSLENSAYALQRLFYLLQTSNDAVPTSELTRSFGWDSRQIFEQEDVQELCRKLMERMEERMKGTSAENALAKLFAAKMKTYVSCINVDFESSRVEDFWDVQLNVSGNRNLEESFKDYVQVEIMDGENRYSAEGHGLQDARKGVIFESFPQVLHLQLKRFEYDVNRNAMMKVNDRYEFPEIFDASPYLSEDADKSEPYIYQLHGVLVHSGDFNAGHYYAFLKPTKDGHFYRFDDDRVTRATMKEVLEENYGGDYNMPNGNAAVRNPYTRVLSTKRSMSAYMLVYIRQSCLDNVLVEVTADDTPAHLRKRLEEEIALREQRRKEREEQHLYLPVQVLTNDSFNKFQGLDLADWDIQAEDDPAAPRSYRVLKSTTIGDLTRHISSDLGHDPAHVRIWVMLNRANKTIRPDRPLLQLNMTVDDAFIRYAKPSPAFRLWAEILDNVEEVRAVWSERQSQPKNNMPILLFLKHFDAEHQILQGAGHIYFPNSKGAPELSSVILKHMNWPKETHLKLYEEIKPVLVEPLKPNQSLVQAEIQDGDLICFEKVLPETLLSAIVQAGGYADARDFYDYLVNRITVRFHPKGHESVDGEVFDLMLSRRTVYDQLAAKVGEHLKVDPTHLRFTTINATSGTPKNPVKRSLTITLQQILGLQYNTYTAPPQATYALFYEVLDLSLSELETKKQLKVTWLSEGISKEDVFDVLVPKNGVITNVVEVLKRKAKIDDCPSENIRIYEVHSCKIYKILHQTFGVAGINDYVSLYAEMIPDEELEPGKADSFINVFHYDKEPSKAYGVPFRFLVKAGEIFKQTKARLEKRTGIKGKQFEGIKFALVQRLSYSKPMYLKDDDVLRSIMSDDDILGMDHVDRSKSAAAGRGNAIFIR